MYVKGYSVVIHESAIKDIIFHCVKSIRIRGYSGTHFPAFGLNTERYSLFSRNAGKCGPGQLHIRTLFEQCLQGKLCESSIVAFKNSYIRNTGYHRSSAIKYENQKDWSKSRKYLYLQNVQINRLNKLKFLHYSRPELMKLIW